MKKTMISFAIGLIANMSLQAEPLNLKDITDGKYQADQLRTVTALSDGEQFAQISEDGLRIESYSYKNGAKTGVLFDVKDTKGEHIDDFDNYILCPNGRKMLIQTKTQRVYRRSFKAVYYIYDIQSKHMDRLSDYGPQQSPVWSPDGQYVAFVRDNNIYLVKLLYDNAESQVTTDGKPNEIINGIPDWVNEEEFGLSTALTFNADASMICWIKYDEKEVPVFSLQTYRGSHPVRDENKTYIGQYSYKYPKAGERNATVSVHSFDIKTKQTRTLQVPLSKDGYIPRIISTSDAQKVLVYTMNRHQDELCLYGVNPKSTIAQLLIKEQVDKYVKEEAMSNILITDSHIIMPSDRSGKMQLYLYSMTGQLQRTLTSGPEVTNVYGYDEKTGAVYYQTVGDTPMDRCVRTTAANGKTQILSEKKGWNSALFGSDKKYFIGIWSDAKTPYEYATYQANGKKLSTLLDNQELKKRISSFQLPSKEFFTLKTSEGVELNGVMLKPADFNSSKKYPVIMWQYSGPGSQQVVNSWSLGSMGGGALFDAWLVEQGFIVVCVDGRGTGGRGAEFEKCTYKHLGELESSDQVEAALWLGRQTYIDADRIGIWGWSYGGFCTLMSMSEGREVFRAGVAVAPPTDWRFYDTIYTERFMQTPQENASGYDVNPIQRASKLHGSLLLCHGLADDNVHPQNTFEYSEALVQADKDFRMNVYTNRNHSIYGGNTRNHLLRQIARHFIDCLK